MATKHIDTTSHELEAIEKYSRLCKVAIGFHVATGNPAELDYAYLNARWSARLALSLMSFYAAEGLIAAQSR